MNPIQINIDGNTVRIEDDNKMQMELSNILTCLSLGVDIDKLKESDYFRVYERDGIIHLTSGKGVTW